MVLYTFAQSFRPVEIREIFRWSAYIICMYCMVEKGRRSGGGDQDSVYYRPVYKYSAVGVQVAL